MDNLKECPFCGAIPELTFGNEYENLFYVMIECCVINTEKYFFKDDVNISALPLLLKDWNTRNAKSHNSNSTETENTIRQSTDSTS